MSDETAINDTIVPFPGASPPVLLIPAILTFALAVTNFPFFRSRISRYGDDPSTKHWGVICSYLLILQCANVLAAAWLHGSQSGSPLILSRSFSDGTAAAKLSFLSVLALMAISMSTAHLVVARILYLINHRLLSYVLAIQAALIQVAFLGLFMFSYFTERLFSQTLTTIIVTLMVVWFFVTVSTYCPLAYHHFMSQRRGKTVFPRVFHDVLNTFGLAWGATIFLFNCISLVTTLTTKVEGTRTLIWLATLLFFGNAYVAFVFRLLRVYYDSTSTLPTIPGRDHERAADEITLL